MWYRTVGPWQSSGAKVADTSNGDLMEAFLAVSQCKI